MQGFLTDAELHEPNSHMTVYYDSLNSIFVPTFEYRNHIGILHAHCYVGLHRVQQDAQIAFRLNQFSFLTYSSSHLLLAVIMAVKTNPATSPPIKHKICINITPPRYSYLNALPASDSKNIFLKVQISRGTDSKSSTSCSVLTHA